MPSAADAKPPPPQTMTTPFPTRPLPQQLRALLSSLSQIPKVSQRDLDALQQALLRQGDGHLYIANAGPMNPGKSTFFNALLNAPERFRTADVRQTTVNQLEPLTDSIILIDTPGCSSAQLADDEEAGAAFRMADLITFVHNISTGGLIRAEMDILAYLQSLFGDDFPNRVLIVCNRTDETADEEEIQRNCSEITAQLHEWLHTSLPLHPVSSTYFFEGMAMLDAGNPDAKVLIQESGIPQLRTHLLDLARKLGPRGLSAIQPILQRLSRIRQEQQLCVDNAQKDYHDAKAAILNDWKSRVNGPILDAWTECRKYC